MILWISQRLIPSKTMAAYPADSASLIDNERCCHCDFDNDDSASCI